MALINYFQLVQDQTDLPNYHYNHHTHCGESYLRNYIIIIVIFMLVHLVLLRPSLKSSNPLHSAISTPAVFSIEKKTKILKCYKKFVLTT